MISQRAALLGVAILAGVTAIEQPASATQFDGQWNMKFMSNSPNPGCRQFGGMVVTIKASQATGRLYHPQAGQYDLTAAVGPDGTVKDGIMRGYSNVTVNGKIEDKAGKGTWTSNTVACTGDWTLTR